MKYYWNNGSSVTVYKFSATFLWLGLGIPISGLDVCKFSNLQKCLWFIAQSVEPEIDLFLRNIKHSGTTLQVTFSNQFLSCCWRHFKSSNFLTRHVKCLQIKSQFSLMKKTSSHNLNNLFYHWSDRGSIQIFSIVNF